MNYSLIFRQATLICAFSCMTTMMIADPNNFTEMVKERFKQGCEWSQAKCDTVRAQAKASWASGKVKWEAFTDDVCKVSDEKFGTHFTERREETKRRRIIEQPKVDLELKAPFEIKEDKKPTGSEPIERDSSTVSQKATVKNEGVNSLELDLSWLDWLSTEEGKMYGKGAIAVITILGVTYVLYKNRVPQRIYGYVAQNPVKAALSGACVLGIAAYVAHQRGVTLDSIKNTFCFPKPA